MRGAAPEPTPFRRQPPVRIEMHCLMCGDVAGVIEDRKIVRPTREGSVRYDGRMLMCGRCGSGLIPGDEVREPDGWREGPEPHPA